MCALEQALVAFHNESGFQPKDLYAMCQVGESSKAAGRSDAPAVLARRRDIHRLPWDGLHRRVALQQVGRVQTTTCCNRLWSATGWSGGAAGFNLGGSGAKEMACRPAAQGCTGLHHLFGALWCSLVLIISLVLRCTHSGKIGRKGIGFKSVFQITDR